MSNDSGSASARGGASQVLLVGDISKAFEDADRAAQCPCEVTASLLNAPDVAARGGFTVIGVVMDGTAGHLHATLRALRGSTDARIVLLARMYEEPIARRLATEESNGDRLADAYLVCPTSLSRFCAGALATVPVPAAKPPEAAPASDGAARPTVDLAELERRMRHLEYLATTDDLTGLKNRRYILEFAGQALERARQNSGRMTLLLFDIDNFKHYNDVYGHLAGDEILRQAGILMCRCCRPLDVVGRIGGDEFAVVFWDDPYKLDSRDGADRRSAGSDHPAEAISVTKRFQNELGRAELPLLGPRGEGELTISGGLASFPRDGATVQELFKQADQALLDAKRSGKNRIYLVGRPQNDIADIH
jgi:GGDEF domain-containing protein